jgi:septal ring factor EnvC (AmiA/AmiB activator)
MKKIGLLLLMIGQLAPAFCQPQTRDELERQRQQLKREIEQTEQLLNENKALTKENLFQWRLINNKVNLQGRVIDNINRDLRLLNDEIYLTQLDINRYDRTLDTLRQEYAKSMVYAYKNRSNYDFLNFIFSASSFNDALKRIAYMKSYRNYREMQGANILRTQELRKQKIEQLAAMKQKKGATLEVQSKEMSVLENQQNEKNQILSKLKKQGKELNKQISAKQKQMQKVNNAINAAIKRAIAEEKKRRELEEKKRRDAEAAAAAAAAAAAKNAAATKASSSGGSSSAAATKAPAPKAAAPKAEAPKRESVLLNAENVALNSNFEKNRGALPWPVDRGVVLMHYGTNKLPSGSTLEVASTTISSDVGSPVKAVFDGTVSTVTSVDEMQVVIIQHGRYFTTYSNLSGVSVSRGQSVRTGQVIGRVAANLDGVGAMDIYISNENNNYDPESWLRRR